MMLGPTDVVSNFSNQRLAGQLERQIPGGFQQKYNISSKRFLNLWVMERFFQSALYQPLAIQESLEYTQYYFVSGRITVVTTTDLH